MLRELGAALTATPPTQKWIKGKKMDGWMDGILKDTYSNDENFPRDILWETKWSLKIAAMPPPFLFSFFDSNLKFGDDASIKTAFPVFWSSHVSVINIRSRL